MKRSSLLIALAFACALLLAPGLLSTTQSSKEEEKKPDEKKWDVNNPPGPKTDVAIKTTKGTWMSVDVSAQGDEMVFDLLGDIYSVPITGGKAKALTTGMAWDMQPRYSPDGRNIAFTSDSDSGRRRQYLGHEAGRDGFETGHQGEFPPSQ